MVDVQVGAPLQIKGFVTQYKFLCGYPLHRIEKLVGYQAGRLMKGVIVAKPDRLPELSEFETAGYSQVPGHRHEMPKDLDPVGLRRMAMSVWASSGRDTLVKLLPVTPHDSRLRDDDQYPVGDGIPQWKITKPIPGSIVAVISNYQEIFNLGWSSSG